MKKRLLDIQMSEKDFTTFTNYRKNVRREIQELINFLASSKAKQEERVWITNKTSGDLDEKKMLIDY
jgi:hypothetical protein